MGDERVVAPLLLWKRQFLAEITGLNVEKGKIKVDFKRERYGLRGPYSPLYFRKFWYRNINEYKYKLWFSNES